MKKTLPSLRVEEKDIENIECAIKKFNKNAIVQINIAGFRRLALKILSNMILSGEEIPIEFKV